MLKGQKLILEEDGVVEGQLVIRVVLKDLLAQLIHLVLGLTTMCILLQGSE